MDMPPIITIDKIDFQKIISEFRVSKKSKYNLPRIAFIGYFRRLSMTSQRDICKAIGFEYYPQIKLATTDQNEMQVLTSKWSDITKGFTRLIVIGNAYDKMPEWHFNMLLYKTYKNDNRPVFKKYKIPLMMESEIWKLHTNYPNINNSTLWKEEYICEIS